MEGKKASDKDTKMQRNIEAEFNPDEEIVIRNPEQLREKILAMRADGKEKLNVIADFDSTLTRKTYNGKRADDSFDTIEKVSLVQKLIERSDG